MTKSEITAKISSLVEERMNLVNRANLEIGRLNGKIELLSEQLGSAPEDPIEAPAAAPQKPARLPRQQEAT